MHEEVAQGSGKSNALGFILSLLLTLLAYFIVERHLLSGNILIFALIGHAWIGVQRGFLSVGGDGFQAARLRHNQPAIRHSIPEAQIQLRGERYRAQLVWIIRRSGG